MRLANRLKELAGPSRLSSTAKPGKTYRNAEWSSLRSVRTLPLAERSGRHVLQLVSGAKDLTVGLVDNHGHAWVRLIEPDGTVFSVGFYPDESTDISPERFPGLTFPGMLLNPDKWDRAGWHELRTSYEISEQQFGEIVGHIEWLQAERSDGSLPFRLLDLNCVWFLAEVARIIDVDVDIEYSLAHHLGRNIARALGRVGARHRWPARRRSHARWSALARIAAILDRRPTRLIANIAGYFAGGRRTFTERWARLDDGVTLQRLANFEPAYRSLSDIGRRSLPFNHVIAFQRWQQAAGPRPDAEASAARAPDAGSEPGPPDRPKNDSAGPDCESDELGAIGQQTEPRQQA